MDAQLLEKLDRNLAVIVPTRSLASSLGERVVQHYLEKQLSVWETPNILTWSDLLLLLWQHNQPQLGRSAQIYTFISNQQSLMLWTKIVEQSRRTENDLALLNVQQTARAAQRSWRMMHDWGVELSRLDMEHISDTQQFCEWAATYKTQLSKRGFVDEQLLVAELLKLDPQLVFKELEFYAFDLVSNAQTQMIEHLKHAGLKINHRRLIEKDRLNPEYQRHANFVSEISAAFVSARELIEQHANAEINIVIPDLQNQRAAVQEIANDVFYPGVSPLELLHSDLVYRFSLGEPLLNSPAIEAAVTVINLLRDRLSLTDVGFLFRNRFLIVDKNWSATARRFVLWLQKRGMSNIKFSVLADLYRQYLSELELRKISAARGHATVVAQTSDTQNAFCGFLDACTKQLEAVQVELNTEKQNSGFRALEFTRWYEVLSGWLNHWGWDTTPGADPNSVQFQLRQRWQKLLEEFASLQLVQNQLGLSRMCEVLRQMVRDVIFLPQAAASPILISGVYEAIGRPVDLCVLTQMDDRYPPKPSTDPFIGNRLRQVAEFPGASAAASYTQARLVIDNLLKGADRALITYAEQDQGDDGIQRSVSALFRHQNFLDSGLSMHESAAAEQKPLSLQQYTDIQGPAWQISSKLQGGASIFENQSNCAFRAFVVHQLGFTRQEEPEFGLDARDRGSIVHLILDELWAQLQTQEYLLQIIAESSTTEPKLRKLVESVVNTVLQNLDPKMAADKRHLLQLERQRLGGLAMQWLEVDAKRPTPFSVVEREEHRRAEFAGIEFNYIIDRLDLLDDGRTAVIDYKTGVVAKRDWQGERIRKPQLPLYALAVEQLKQQGTSGIAYAKVKQHDCKYEELAEVGIFNREYKRTLDLQVLWHESKAAWPEIFENLAADFLAGKAAVNPIDEATCSYCELQAVCRVSQLRIQSEACQ